MYDVRIANSVILQTTGYQQNRRMSADETGLLFHLTGSVLTGSGVKMKTERTCWDCPHLIIKSVPLIIGRETYEDGKAECTKLNMIIRFGRIKDLREITCEEETNDDENADC